ncbi:hypothetical protein [Burkholderia gladioli]|uniref:hypothetical protein n=1 Tax=Burkholderia gladioli TaxID=28095 RepID=UPI00164185AC|nr:hypothetical protein [Burkholderia gladioli]
MTNERTTPADAEMQKLTVARSEESATPTVQKVDENTREVAAAPSHNHTCHDGDDCVACDAEQSAAATGEQATLIAKAREHAFREAASVDAKVIAMLMATGKVSREDVDTALARVAALQASTDTQTAPKTGERPMYVFLMPGDVQLATDEVFSRDTGGWVPSSPAFVGEKYMDWMPPIRRAAAALHEIRPPGGMMLPPMPDATELLEISRATGLRSFLHGVNATDAREILENYQVAVDARRLALPAGNANQAGRS